MYDALLFILESEHVLAYYSAVASTHIVFYT